MSRLDRTANKAWLLPLPEEPRQRLEGIAGGTHFRGAFALSPASSHASFLGVTEGGLVTCARGLTLRVAKSLKEKVPGGGEIRRIDDFDQLYLFFYP